MSNNTVTHSESSGSHSHKASSAALLLGAIGVVYGDIGTSPLYALKECFLSEHAPALTPDNIMGVLSLVFWSIMMVVTLKYLVFIMKADNHGEGGILALFALTHKLTGDKGFLAKFALTAGLLGAALFYSDGIITPAISVLSAVEGLGVIAPKLATFILPTALAILILLFSIQHHGTELIGKFFGPIMCLWFLVLATLGVINILHYPDILKSINPWYALYFIQMDPRLSFLSLGAVVLTLTGAEALYADMGHFGRQPIRYAWFSFVMPALLLNYYGQGALLIQNPAAVQNPFYLLAPEWALIPLVILATLATVIASQAVITGAFSLTKQAVQLGFFPRVQIHHTSAKEIGQIYVPIVNWGLLIGVILLVVMFKTSSGLAAAYGIAVTGTMVVTTLLAGIVMLKGWHWHWAKVTALMVVFLVVDLAFFGSNLHKIPSGGWLPLAMGVIIFTVLITWRQGKRLVAIRLAEIMPLTTDTAKLRNTITLHAPGTAVFMTSNSKTIPNAFLHNMEHNKVLHDRVVFLTLAVEDEPYLQVGERIEIQDLGAQFYRVVARYGFMEDPDVPTALALCAPLGLVFDLEKTSFFLSREIAIPTVRPGMALWREHLFSWMGRNATSPMEYFNIPTHRVVDLGCHLDI
ncbi:putative potassium transport system protein kup 1 [Crenothrix polyspora]|uniref:Probable potassium transport system protein Kup n=1 Tax=Crenothrix polyspora TaxID=360316 RepID=A0A1R4H0L9_9GAMM|nr:potassium transporter Kup [Crenothrix polyspora]SJM89783.1 putative potassium transport system protein kup 1 [Crenothrix polyspora]